MDQRLYEPERDEAREFLERDLTANLPMLGSLLYEPLETLLGLRRDGVLVALGLVVAEEPHVPGSLPTVMLDAVDAETFGALAERGGWPQRAIWSAQRPEHRTQLEATLRQQADPNRGVVYFGATTPPAVPPVARVLGSADSSLDLSPCSLSAMALSYWMLRGWRVFGVVEGSRLIGHALAAYPIGDTEEVAAVFTAPEARRQGVASACAAAAIADICARGKRAIYVSRRNNHASIGVAEGLGMARLLETWEIVNER